MLCDASIAGHDLGYEVHEAYDGAAALRLIDQHVYQLVVLDYLLPDMDGLELYARIREQQPNVFCVSLTGYASIDMIEAALAAGAKRVVPKSTDVEELRTAVREIVLAVG